MTRVREFNEIKREARLWLERCSDNELLSELSEISTDEARLSDAFYRHLEFGTGGLRGVLGVGTNRMNIHTVTRATLGIASYIKAEGLTRVAAIGYDTRRYSKEFAERVAVTLAEEGIKAYIYSEPLPTPMLSYAVRSLGASVGIMITASHNPAEYNGYKVYGRDGCQITDKAAERILAEIESHGYFDGKGGSLSEHIGRGSAEYISESVFDDFISAVESTSVRDDSELDLSVGIVYTNLNGTGIRPVSHILKKRGYKSLSFVREQMAHDGAFPTCPYPNPEIPEALSLGIAELSRRGADILIATDPDCDRVGVAVREGRSTRILTGNEVGILLFDYILEARRERGSMPKRPVAVKTIVTTDLAERIAKKHNVTVKNVLTGFKYIGETVGELEKHGRASDYVFGFEESCGYLSSSYVRDKDGVFAAYLVAEMAAYYKKQGKSLSDRLSEIYREHGYSVTELRSYAFGGADGFKKMQSIMDAFRDNNPTPCGISLKKAVDYLEGVDGLPVSNVLKLHYEGASLTARPSGTEPKLKLYVYAEGKDEAEARERCALIFKEAEALIHSFS